MAKFVGAALCTHIPRLFILDPAARKAYMGDEVTTMYEAMESMYAERIAALDVDTFIVVDTHWFSTIDYILNANERLSGSYTSEELPDMIHDYEYDYRGDRRQEQRACQRLPLQDAADPLSESDHHALSQSEGHGARAVGVGVSVS